jgi:hypothetical protein
MPSSSISWMLDDFKVSLALVLVVFLEFALFYLVYTEYTMTKAGFIYNGVDITFSQRLALAGTMFLIWRFMGFLKFVPSSYGSKSEGRRLSYRAASSARTSRWAWLEDAIGSTLGAPSPRRRSRACRSTSESCMRSTCVHGRQRASRGRPAERRLSSASRRERLEILKTFF